MTTTNKDLGSLKVGLKFDSSELKSSLATINSQMTVLDSEIKKGTSGFTTMGKTADALKTQISGLTEKIDLQKQKVALLKSALDDSILSKGRDDKATQDLEIKYNNAATALNKMEQELKDTNKELKETPNLFNKMHDSMDKVSTKLSTLGNNLTTHLTLPIVGAATGLGALISKTTQSAGELQKMSDITGLSAERLQELRYVGSQVDVELDTIANSQKLLTKAMESAKNGTKLQKDAFKQLGITIVDSNGNLRDSNEIFGEAIDALGKMTNPTERDATALQIFGKSAMELNPLIKAGSIEIARLTKEAHDNGAVISNEGIASMDNFGDSIEGLKLSLQGAVGEVVEGMMPTLQDKLIPFIKEKVLPAIGDFIEKVGDLVSWFSGLDEGTQKVIATAGLFLLAIGPASKLVSGIASFGGVIANLIGIAGKGASAGVGLAGMTGLLAWAAGIGIIGIEVSILVKGLVDLQKAIDLHKEQEQLLDDMNEKYDVLLIKQSQAAGMSPDEYAKKYGLSGLHATSKSVNYLPTTEYTTKNKYPSHKLGLDNVPFDGYTAILHKDEGILTAKENSAYKQLLSVVNASKNLYGSVNSTKNISNTNNNNLTIIVQNLNNTRSQDVKDFAEELEFYRMQKLRAKGGVA